VSQISQGQSAEKNNQEPKKQQTFSVSNSQERNGAAGRANNLAKSDDKACTGLFSEKIHLSQAQSECVAKLDHVAEPDYP
jgi:hypothetical protein